MVLVRKLLDFDDSAGFFQLLLGIHGGVFADCSKDFAIGGFGQGFGFGQAKAHQLADDFNDFDLLGTGVLDDDVKFGLLFNSLGGSCGSSQTNRKGEGEISSGRNLRTYPGLRTEWIIIWIRAGPNAGRIAKLVAFHAMGTAVRQNPRRVRQLIHRIKHFSFQRNFTHDMFAITYLAGFPCTLSHNTPPNLQIPIHIESKTSRLDYPVTGIMNPYDNSRYLDSISP